MEEKDPRQERIIQIGVELLDLLIQKKAKDPDFTFSIRKRTAKDRTLESGNWFQGSDYLCVPLFKPVDNTRKISTIGFVIEFEKNGAIKNSYIQFTFRSKDKKRDKEEIQFYKDLIKEQKANFNDRKDVAWTIFENPDSYLENFRYYIGDFYTRAIVLIKSRNLDNLFNISEDEFLPLYDKIVKIRNTNNFGLKTLNDTHKVKNILNQILFGPPGTGKTFNTINEAIKIVDQEYYKAHQQDRDKLKDRFKDLLITDEESREGQIAFCTFHQSFSYEDFVEGIKPLKPNLEKDTYLKYDVVPGIFRKLCQLSEDYAKSQQLKTKRLISWDAKTYSQASFYKISLGDSTLTEDNEIFEYCIKNNCIAMGFGNGQDFSSLDEAGVKNKCNALGLVGYDPQALNLFINYIKVGNYVVVSNGLKYCRAIGKVTGNYRYEANSPIRYNNFRDVEWIFVDENIPVGELYNKNFSQQTIYKLDSQEIKKEFFVPEGQLVMDEVKEKNFVLIIDEINRGNVSAIFGELITLIEHDKRAGADEELRITLPYSKKEFKVPANVYLIGTMNTADRSIEALDTALRRRFEFIEKPPVPNLIKEQGISKVTNGVVDGIDLVLLLDKINLRIEKLIDKDHKIGHAYFMGVGSINQLKEAFHNKVIPLLEEYFFGDFGKIGLVLGESFIDSDEETAFDFAPFGKYDSSIQQDLKTRKVFKIKPQDQWDFVSVYK